MFLQRNLQKFMKKNMIFETSDTSCLSQWPREPAYYVVDWQISYGEGGGGIPSSALQEIVKTNIILGTSKAWSMIHLSHRPSEPAYYIEDCRISYGEGGGIYSSASPPPTPPPSTAANIRRHRGKLSLVDFPLIRFPLFISRPNCVRDCATVPPPPPRPPPPYAAYSDEFLRK